jgi:hypothetical protein
MKKCFPKKYVSLKFIFIATGIALAIAGGLIGKRMMERARTFDSE